MLKDWSEGDLSDIIVRHPEWFADDDSPPTIDPVPLGTGESYAVWRTGDLVIRIARRPVAELPVDLAQERAALLLAPAGLGPRVIGAGEVEVAGAGAFPYLVESFVPGRILTPAQWSDGLRALLVADLARLHERTWPGPGTASEALAGTGPAPGRIDIVGRVEEVVDWWAPRLGEAEREAWWALVAPMRAYGREVAGAFAEVAQFSLIHGDPVCTNILVHQGVPRLIDWEWAAIGDPARDIGFLGGAVHAAPWYAPLDDGQVDALVRAYVDAGGLGDVASLRVRRDAWLALEGFSTSAYLCWVVADNPGRDHGWRPVAAQQLLTTLSDFLAPFAAHARD